ncbi:hypothetical protein LH392_01270 [Corynebacterium uberis]|uniref:hypothetical protein n=1 Tax=Corynebacterium uberis TaxID=2883169 RepID=UPI001D0B777F|nr:hypothetical protein [Corynebacterium uberis]MCZ9309928.1 hypothetical protein [Corynebacterium sp. c6VSa_13]UDL80467.1 hypothetical protein LH392_01270 [Corynebacterium uberis]UDL82602.1 hypothetical protein LH395_00845 [Corynebacterium uberis]UDL84809.1 hypothetical protein LH390_00845 [Corynebacterium uberis]
MLPVILKGQGAPVRKRALKGCIVLTLIIAISSTATAAPVCNPPENRGLLCSSQPQFDRGHTRLTRQDIVWAEAVIDHDLVSALAGVEIPYQDESDSRAVPLVAAVAVAVVGWCVNGALSSVAPSAIQEMVSQATAGKIAPPDWVMNAIFGCAGGPVLGALTTQAMRVKFASAVLAFVIKIRNIG